MIHNSNNNIFCGQAADVFVEVLSIMPVEDYLKTALSQLEVMYAGWARPLATFSTEM